MHVQREIFRRLLVHVALLLFNLSVLVDCVSEVTKCDKPYELWWIGDHEGFSVLINTLLFYSTSKWIGWHQVPERDCGIHIHFAPNRNQHFNLSNSDHPRFDGICLTDFVRPVAADDSISNRVTWDCDGARGLLGNDYIAARHKCAFLFNPSLYDTDHKWLRNPQVWGLSNLSAVDMTQAFHPKHHDCLLTVEYRNVSEFGTQNPLPNLQLTRRVQVAALDARKCLFGDKEYRAIHWRRGDQLWHRGRCNTTALNPDTSINCETHLANVVDRFRRFSGKMPLYVATNERDEETLNKLTQAGFTHHRNARHCFDSIKGRSNDFLHSPLGFFVDLELMAGARKLWLPGKSFVHMVVGLLIDTNKGDGQPPVIVHDFESGVQTQLGG
eukprot:m.54585 g.54585  ORF g.54585 m.54585 type:complete len:384 (-) comp21937_c0_seq1:19-1170(-)